MNLYAYAGNNPVAFSDPLGLTPCLVNPIVCMAVAGALIMAGTQVVQNLVEGRDVLEDVPASTAKGFAIGGTLGGTVVSGLFTSAAATPFTPSVLSAAPAATHPGLRNTIGALFQSTDRLPGGTAGALINEAATGRPTNGLWHLSKAVERAANLGRLIRGGDLSASDLKVARRLQADLNAAINYWRKVRGE